MKTKLTILLVLIGAFFSNITFAYEFIDEFAAKEKVRVDQMITLAEDGENALLDLTVAEMNKLNCHVTQNGKWLKCDWAHSAAQCKSIGWIPHTDGSCCKQIGNAPSLPISFSNQDSEPVSKRDHQLLRSTGRVKYEHPVTGAQFLQVTGF